MTVLLIMAVFLRTGTEAKEPDFDVEVGVKAYYTSNLYRVTEKQEDQFDSKDDPGERFFDMEGPEDFVTRPGADLNWKWDVAKKRDLEFSLGADYYVHARNTIADYLRLQTNLAYDLTRDDRVGLGFEFLPDRFKRNLSLQDPGSGNKIFDRADYQQMSVAPRYSHDWNKDLSTGIEYEYSDREYDSPFENRCS